MELGNWANKGNKKIAHSKSDKVQNCRLIMPTILYLVLRQPLDGISCVLKLAICVVTYLKKLKEIFGPIPTKLFTE